MKTTLQNVASTIALIVGFGLPLLAQDRDSSDSIVEDAAPPTEAAREHDENIVEEGEDRLIFEATLAKGLSFIPAPKQVINTAYVFKVDDLVEGRADGDYVTIFDTGGQLRDGRTMDTVESFRLVEGDRYLVFARRGDGEWWLDNVLAITDREGNLADASGRMVIGVENGRLLVERRVSQKSLRYMTPLRAGPSEMDDAPEGTLELPAQPRAFDAEAGRPLRSEHLKQFLRGSLRGDLKSDSIPVRDADPSREDGEDAREEDAPNDDGEDAAGGDKEEARRGPKIELPEAEPRDFQATPESVLSGQHVRRYQSHYHYMPNNNHWNWSGACRGSWNRLVNAQNGFRLFAYKVNSQGDPIRNRLPRANDGRYNSGVLSNAQMTSGGYDTWTSLGANGVCYRWWNSSNRVTETDVLVNPAIANDEVQFRKTYTHELGHSLTLGHERRYMALMYPGTFRQPPNYRSTWYTRRDDHRGVRSMLQWVNSNISAGSWNIAQFADPATWSMAHPNPGNNTNLVMTTINDRTLNRGQTATIRNFHIENRGTQPAQNTQLKFYLSTNRTISTSDRQIASYTWSSLSSYWTGNLNVRVPAGTPRGSYFLGWRITTDSNEPSTANNTALLLNGRSSGFSAVTVTIQ